MTTNTLETPDEQIGILCGPDGLIPVTATAQSILIEGISPKSKEWQNLRVLNMDIKTARTEEFL